MALPPFLNPIPFRNPVAVDGAALVPYTEARFRSERLALESHALWWGSRGVEPSTVLVVIPGNPGLARFYTPFLSTLHQKCDGAIPIVISALVGHTPGINDEDPDFAPLLTQVEHFVQLVDAAAAVYGRVMLAGHSIGSWLTLQVLKARAELVDNVFLLFPTIAHMHTTPNGKALSWFFYPPLPRIISLASYLTRLIPQSVLARLLPQWPAEQLAVLRSLLDSPSSIFSALSLAHDEMVTVREPDVPLLQTFSSRIHIYYGAEDAWVGEQKERLLKELELHTDVKIAHGPSDIPHAFVLNHGEQVADQCYQWISSSSVAFASS